MDLMNPADSMNYLNPISPLYCCNSSTTETAKPIIHQPHKTFTPGEISILLALALAIACGFICIIKNQD